MIFSLSGAPIYSAKLESVDNHKQLLEPFITNENFWRQADEWKSRTTTTHQHKNNHELPWNNIIPEINQHFDNYLETFDPKDSFEVETHPWLNRYAKGEWQEQHNHFAPNLFFSFAYIIQSNGTKNFVFSDNPYSWYSHFNAKDYFNKWPGRQYVPEQDDGTLFIFPSTIDHFVMPNLVDEYRVSASGNFIIHG